MSRLATDRGRLVPVTFGAATAVLVTLAVALALSTPPPSTPPIGAVAPQVQQHVEVERREQASRSGTGAAGDAVGGAGACAIAGCDEAAPEAQPDTVVSAPPDVATSPAAGSPVLYRECWFGPGGARQTEDPQSPPCRQQRFPPDGDNGGATALGVTADSITVAVPTNCPQPGGNPCGWHGDQRVLQALADHINDHYELYNRRLRLVYVAATSDTAQQRDPAYQRAFAQEVAAVQPFATLEYNGWGPFYEEVARRGIVALAASRAYPPATADLRRLDPFVWSVYPTRDESLSVAGALICDALAGRTARHGGQDVAQRTRRFAVVEQRDAGASFEPTVLVNRLRACGADHRVDAYEPGVTDVAGLLRRLQDDGVTTVVCACPSLPRSFPRAADDIGYQPEWLHPGFRDTGVSNGYAARTNPDVSRQQRAHMFGLTPLLRRPEVDGAARTDRYDEQYWFTAARESDPSLEPGRPDAEDSYVAYAQLLVLASGIQWAGPDLTPETFAAALEQLRYPNPGVGAAPWWQPAVGFGPDDRTFNSDFALFWWRNAEEAEERAGTDLGGSCYVGGGARYTAATLPADADRRFFDAQAGCR